MIITIDGPAGTGKSSVAKKIAQALDFDYFDTGALYRSFTFYILDRDIDPSNKKDILEILPQFDFQIEGHFPNLRYIVDGKDVTDSIRSFEVNQYVSVTSAYGEVRHALIQYQRSYALKKDCVFEGRDLGTVVFPDADLKVFLTASAEVRAKRRYKELTESKLEYLPSYEEILTQINLRDRIDSTRKVAPLKCPEGALYIDTSSLTLDEVVQKVIEEKRRIAAPGFLKPKQPKKKSWLKVFLPAWMTCSKMSLLYRFVLCVTWCYVKIFYRLRVVGRGNIPDEACLLACNHVSFLDPPLVAVSASSEIHFLARDTLFKPRFFGGFIRRLNCHPLRREGSDIGAIKTIVSLLSQGDKVLVFPQGTRSDRYEVEDLKGGIYFLASKAKVKVVPTFVAGPLEIWPRKEKRPKTFGRVACLFGRPIEINELLEPAEAQREFLKSLRDEMNELGREAKKLLRPR